MVARWLRGTLAASFVLVAGFVAAQDLTADQKKEVLDGLKNVLETRAFVPGIDFKKWSEFVEKQKEAIERANTVEIFASQVNRSLREFGLSHIRLATPRATSRRGQTTATGVGVTTERADEGLRVRGVAPQGPAKEVGLEAGDVITKVNGAKPDTSTALEGDAGAKLTLEVKKASGEVKTIEVERKVYSTVRKETLTYPDPDVACLKVFTFSAGYGRENVETLLKEAAKSKYLILDLRSNGGGAVNNLNHLLSLLMPDGTPYGTFLSRRTVDDYLKAMPEGPLDPVKIAEWAPNKTKTRKRAVEPYAGKIAVLINRGSGSASEITAAALRESRSAILLGSKSAGAVLASTYGRLPHGFSVQYPVSDYVTAKGMRLEKNPLAPDIEVVGTAQGDEDPVVKKAVEALKKD
ncbi:MAG TPA: S41 family peptidase [Fimbriimonadaceae bacterium]|nr:S41 family peptidase [Fimbriimonadaceae bacterium]